MGSVKGTVRPIRHLGDPVLRTACDPVTAFDADLKRLVDDMFASMYDARGVGLAANQIGVAKRIFVYDCADDDAGAPGAARAPKHAAPSSFGTDPSSKPPQPPLPAPQQPKPTEPGSL